MIKRLSLLLIAVLLIAVIADARSSQWSRVRNAYIAEHNECAACGRTSDLQIHHIRPFNKFPELELDTGNLITLCVSGCNCHLSIGHGGNFKYYNENVVEDCKYFRRLVENRLPNRGEQ